MECLYADPERKVTQIRKFTKLPWFYRLSFVLKWCLFCLLNMQAYDVLGLYYGLGRTFFNPASVRTASTFLCLIVY